MADSLLAHLYSRIRGSQEDVATIALQYIVSRSSILNDAFTKKVAECLGIGIDVELRYNCQSVGEKKERPDLVGTDALGREIILCEMKFYAGLTANQPLGYIDRLKAKHGKGLVFICPKARMTTLWSKLCDICAERNVEIIKKHCVRVDGVSMGILTWADVIDELERVAKVSEREYSSDIHQLKGYCAQMDSDAFVPFVNEDIAAASGKKILRYYQVIDETVNIICAEDVSASIVGKASTYTYGYERKMRIGEFVVSLAYDHALWKSSDSIETPFWVSICDKERKQTDFFLERLSKIEAKKRDDSAWNTCYLALEPLLDATLDEVSADLKVQIYRYLDCFRKRTNG